MIRNAEYVMALIIDPQGLAKPAQVGVDLTIKSINKIAGSLVSSIMNVGAIYNDASLATGKKNSFNVYEPIEIVEEKDGRFFFLDRGTYSVEFDQGLYELPATNTAFIWQRSTLGRNGVIIRSSVFDPGFSTPNIGAILSVGSAVIIEEHARIAQIVVHENEPASLYNGQYKGAKDFR